MRGNRMRGFTLVELMVTLAVVGIVAAVAVPAMQTMFKSNTTTSDYNELQGYIAFARSESAKTPGARILLCPSNDGATCTITADWEIGWIIARDTNANGAVDPAENVLKVVEPLTGSRKLAVKIANGAFNANAVSFQDNGNLATNGAVTFLLCDDRGSEFALGVVISIAGQTRHAVDQNNDGIRDDHAEQSFSCGSI